MINNQKTLGIDEILDAVELILELAPGPDDQVALLGDQPVKLLDLVQDVHVLLGLSLQLLVKMSVNFSTPVGNLLCKDEC